MSKSDRVRWFKSRAKKLLRAYRAGDQEVINLIRKYTHNLRRIHLQKVQHVVAKDAGFSNWDALLQATDEQLGSIIERNIYSDVS